MTQPDEITSSKSSESANEHQQIFKMSLALGLGVGLIYLAFLKPGIWGIDGNEMFWVSHSLVTEGDFSIPQGAGVLGRGGEYYSIRYPLLPILATPFVAMGLLVANILGLPSRYTATVFALLLSVIVTAISTSFVALLALRLGSSKKGAYLAALSYAFGTTALVYSREFFTEPLLGLITIVSVYLALGKNYRSHAGASILAGFAITAKPSAIVLGPLLSFYFFCKKYPWRTVIGPLLGMSAGILLYMGYNYIRFESIARSGQSYDRFQLLGVVARFIGLLISPGAGGGLFWYCPPTLLAFVGFRYAFKKGKHLEFLLVMGTFLGYLCLHSLWVFRGWNWGPRLLVPALPVLMVLTAFIPRKWWAVLLGLTLLGLFWNAPTLVSFYQRYFAEAYDRGQFLDAVALWGSPLDAPLFNGWGAAFRQLGDAFSTDVRTVISNVGAPPVLGELASSDLLRIVAVWWWVLPAAGIPIWVGFLVAMMLILTGIWILRRGWLQLDSQHNQSLTSYQ
jgi:hypothetical protein